MSRNTALHPWLWLLLALWLCGVVGLSLVDAASVPSKPVAPNAPASTAPAGPEAFRAPDGAYQTLVSEAAVDPYFVNKAFIIRLDAGLDVREGLRAWLRWLLPNQRPDGGFDRYCRRNERWVVCQQADADDSMAATTLHLITLARQRGWLDADLNRQADVAYLGAQRLLQALRDTRTGLYRVFANQNLFLLMDNAEVYDALIITRQTQAAAALATAIRTQFHHGHEWAPSLTPYDRRSFYPHDLAPAYLWTNGLIPSVDAGAEMAAWVSQHSQGWLSRQSDAYPWGLVAWQLRRAAPAMAACWRAAIRQNPPTAQHWTLLDASIDEALAHVGIGQTCAQPLSRSTR